MENLEIRLMDAAEFDEMKRVSVAAFGGDEAIDTLLGALHTSWAWRDELSFVAVFDGEIVGQVLYTYAILDAPERLIDVLVLSPVGVHPDLQLEGVGSQLIEQSLAILEQRDDPLVFLEGSPLYYPRFGFAPGGDFGFIKPSQRIPDPAFMVRELGDPDALSRLSGTLVYPDAFWRTDSVGLR